MKSTSSDALATTRWRMKEFMPPSAEKVKLSMAFASFVTCGVVTLQYE